MTTIHLVITAALSFGVGLGLGFVVCAYVIGKEAPEMPRSSP